MRFGRRCGVREQRPIEEGLEHVRRHRLHSAEVRSRGLDVALSLWRREAIPVSSVHRDVSASLVRCRYSPGTRHSSLVIRHSAVVRGNETRDAPARDRHSWHSLHSVITLISHSLHSMRSTDPRIAHQLEHAEVGVRFRMRRVDRDCNLERLVREPKVADPNGHLQ